MYVSRCSVATLTCVLVRIISEQRAKSILYTRHDSNPSRMRAPAGKPFPLPLISPSQNVRIPPSCARQGVVAPMYQITSIKTHPSRFCLRVTVAVSWATRGTVQYFMIDVSSVHAIRNERASVCRRFQPRCLQVRSLSITGRGQHIIHVLYSLQPRVLHCGTARVVGGWGVVLFLFCCSQAL